MSFLHRLAGLPPLFLDSIASWSCLAFLGPLCGEIDEVESITSFGNDHRPSFAAQRLSPGQDGVVVLNKPQFGCLQQPAPLPVHSTQRAPRDSNYLDVKTTLQVDARPHGLFPAPTRVDRPPARPQPHRTPSSVPASASSHIRSPTRLDDIGPVPSFTAPQPPSPPQKSSWVKSQATDPPATSNSRHHVRTARTCPEDERVSFVRPVADMDDSQLSIRTAVKTSLALETERRLSKSPRDSAMHSFISPPGRDRIVSLQFGYGPKSWNVMWNTLRPSLAFGMDNPKLPPLGKKVPTFTVYVANRLYTSPDDQVLFSGYISRPGIDSRDCWESSMSNHMIGQSEDMGRDDSYTKYRLAFKDWNSAFSVDSRPGRENLQLSVQVFHLTVKDLAMGATARTQVAIDNLTFDV